MKNKIKSFHLVTAIAATIILALTSCGKSLTNPLVGSWKLEDVKGLDSTGQISVLAMVAVGPAAIFKITKSSIAIFNVKMVLLDEVAYKILPENPGIIYTDGKDGADTMFYSITDKKLSLKNKHIVYVLKQ